MEQNLIAISRFLSLVLRHKPEAASVTVDEHGWASVDDLLRGVWKIYSINMDILEKIVREDNKQRYSINEDKTLIRANQGHSILVDVELQKTVPPAVLRPGTAERFVPSILSQGLLPMSRLCVHLSGDPETAKKVGSRHGKLVVFQVDTAAMAQEGLEFFLSVNGVWLTRTVPVQYLTQIELKSKS